MDRKEAIQILGLRCVWPTNGSEASVNRNRIKDAHRRMMIANHPDRGGSPYLASSMYGALTQKSTRRRTCWSAQRRASAQSYRDGLSVGIHVGIHQPPRHYPAAIVHPRCHGIRGAWAKQFWETGVVAYASLISRRRRIVLGLDRGTYLRTVAAAVVFIDQAPPATTFLHALQFQIPTAWRFTVSLPQKEHV